MPYAEFWIVQTQVRSFGFVIQDFLSHGISIPIGSSNKFTKKLVKLLCQNCWIDQRHMVDHVQILKSVMVTLLLGHIGMFVVLESIKLHFEHSQERPPLMLLCYRDVFHSVSFLNFCSVKLKKAILINQVRTTMSSFFLHRHNRIWLW